MLDSNEGVEMPAVDGNDGVSSSNPNQSNNSIAGRNIAICGNDDVPQQEEEGDISPPASKRMKHHPIEGGDSAVSVDLFTKSPPPSNNDEVAATENLDDRKPAADPTVGGISKLGPDDQCSASSCLQNSSKRKRVDENHQNDDDINNEALLPLAPTLDEYLKNGGHNEYRPRPEWYRFPNDEFVVPVEVNLTVSASSINAISSSPPSSSSAVGRRAAAFERMMADRLFAEGRMIGDARGYDFLVNNNDPGMVEHHPGVPPIEVVGRGDGGSSHNNNNDNDNDMVEIHRDGDEEAARLPVGGVPLAAALHAARAEIRRNIRENYPLAIRPEDGSMFSGGGGGDVAIRPAGGHRQGHHNRHHNPPRFGRGPRPRPAEGGPDEQPLPSAPSAAAVGSRRHGFQFEGIPPGVIPAGRRAVDPAPANMPPPVAVLPQPYPRAIEVLERVAGESATGSRGFVDGEGGAGDPSAAGGGRPAGDRLAAPLFPQPYQRAREALERAADENMGFRIAVDSAQRIDTQPQQVSSGSPDNDPSSPSGGEGKVAVFGFECDSALHLAIKQHATEAALGLIRLGACINVPNAKGITPLMIASQEGTLDVVRALLNKGALPNATTVRGSTALIQACHFGKLLVVEELLRHGALVDQANLKNTTALMRASQEGHAGVVQLLLSHHAGVNRRNDERMTALMLCSQRGHANIVKMLVKEGAQVDAKTAQDSTSLMLACKRKHIEVAKILVASGTELKLKDCKNRSVLETAMRRGNDEFIKILKDNAQVTLMQEASRFVRNFSMVRVWKLLQSERATIKLGGVDVTIHTVANNMDTPILRHVCPSKRALVRAMTLPAPLIELISRFLPLPLIWEKRLMLLTSRSHVDPDSAVYNALDLIDEVLEVGGIIEAFDAAGVNPPSSFASWLAYRSWCGKCDVIISRCADLDVTNIFAQESDAGVEIVESNGMSPSNLRPIEASQTQRRKCNYLQAMSRAPQSLTTILSSHPYDMPSGLFAKLIASHDIQSVVRRFTGGRIHFDTNVANEMVVMARMAVMWCESRPQY